MPESLPGSRQGSTHSPEGAAARSIALRPAHPKSERTSPRRRELQGRWQRKSMAQGKAKLLPSCHEKQVGDRTFHTDGRVPANGSALTSVRTQKAGTILK